ncbi:MAG: hypothetical protein HY361_04970 [Candidatus Aenigmarchaeota archaeon]|nr:hypothetical protein [Candidatus Aenigmarchaeota archaeon]
MHYLSRALREMLESVREHSRELPSNQKLYYNAMAPRDPQILRQLGVLGEPITVIRSEFNRGRRNSGNPSLRVYPVNMERVQYLLNLLNELTNRRGSEYLIGADELL